MCLYGFGVGFGFLVLVSVLLFIRSGFFGFKINDWPYYMYNLVNATNMLLKREKNLTRHIYGL